MTITIYGQMREPPSQVCHKEDVREFWIDVGGTFTDCYGASASGELRRCKVLSSARIRGVGVLQGEILCDEQRGFDQANAWQGCVVHLRGPGGEVIGARRVMRSAGDVLTLESGAGDDLPWVRYEIDAGEEAPITGIRRLLGVGRREKLPRLRVRLGTTRGTNALLTRRGARTGVVVTEGFADVLRIGRQNRPRLFELTIRRPELLYEAVVEAPGRLDASGAEVAALDLPTIGVRLLELRERGVDSLAICLMHAWRHDAHERAVERLARELGFEEVSRSSAVAPVIGQVGRGETTVLDAYLNPVLRRYVSSLRDALGEGSELRLMTSTGSLVEAASFRGRDSILSGPAGGVVALSAMHARAGGRGVIGFDMGGTSTDVSRYDGAFELAPVTDVEGVRVTTPMLAIETIAAGGGSVCWFDGAALRVGPQSAGADPGPACYGAGGPLTVTDLNVHLGRIPADRFPLPLDTQAVRERLEALASEVHRATGRAMEADDLAEALVRVANASMARAVRRISSARGFDPRGDVLVGFGGAAPQHACAVARELGMRRVMNHPDGGLFSAWGMGRARLRRSATAPMYALLDECAAAMAERLESLEAEARRLLAADGVEGGALEIEREADLRYAGRDAALTVRLERGTDARAAYEVLHARVHGYVDEGCPIEVVTLRVWASEAPASFAPDATPGKTDDGGRPERHEPVCFGGRRVKTAVVERCDLAAGRVVEGPAIVAEPWSTTVIEPGWRARVVEGGVLEIEDVGVAPARVDDADDPAALEVFLNRFAGIAEQMGAMLERTSRSVNVKERLDYSCALFTAAGDLLVNAPHMPVHLGAMAESVRWTLKLQERIEPGDVFVSNDPWRGGSHLPDVTVMTPLHDGTGRLVFWVASRAHHAEIGGVTPGSMPPGSRTLAEEGVLITNRHLVRAGVSCFEEVRRLLESGAFPSRCVEDNLADMRAQVAANRCGVTELSRLMERHGSEVAAAWAARVIAATATKMRQRLARLPDGERAFTDHLDDGTPIAVRIAICGEEATVDFTGTGGVSAGNLNANRAIVSAAVMYVFRLLIDEDIPINQGVLEPVRMVVPPGLLDPAPGADAASSPAVVGGNVETSQRVVDVLLGALGLAAASQGTMNNVVFGDERFGYYETICGGSGATRDGAGTDAVHTHMTNTRITDAEVMEHRFPVRVERFGIRRGSGGKGRHRGGDGGLRVLRFLQPMELSVLTQRRGAFVPYGCAGGGPGAPGRQTLLRSDGREERLAAAAHASVQAGDVLVMETPGGGAWGAWEGEGADD